MTLNRVFLRGIVVGFFLCLTGSLALGQSNRTWVSGNGNDSNTATNCPRANPCATFSAALSVTNAGGEIDAVDSGDFSAGATLPIYKSVSIVADGVVAGIEVASGDVIDVNAGSTDVVLRGLTIDGSGSSGIGISFTSGGALHIEGCTINGFSNFQGINVNTSGSSKVFIKDTIVRDNGTGIRFSPSGNGTVTASLDNVSAENNGAGVEVDEGATVSVRNSVAANGGVGFWIPVAGSRLAVMNLESSMASGNGEGIESKGANSTINISNVTVVNNTIGLVEKNGQIVSFGNNKITDNTTNGSPTKTISQK